MAKAAANAQWQAKHDELPYHDGSFTKWGKERSERTPFHFSEGVTIWVASTNLNPDDDFL